MNHSELRQVYGKINTTQNLNRWNKFGAEWFSIHLCKNNETSLIFYNTKIDFIVEQSRVLWKKEGEALSIYILRKFVI